MLHAESGSDDSRSVRENIDRLEASSRVEYRSTSAPPTTRGSSEKSFTDEGPSTPPAASPLQPKPTPPYLPDTRPATIVASRENASPPDSVAGVSARDAREGTTGKPVLRGNEQKPSSGSEKGLVAKPEAKMPTTDAANAATTQHDRTREVSEPGWMTALSLGESGGKFTIPSRYRPYVCWIPVFLRLPQAVFALISFAAAASMSHPRSCADVRDARGTDLLERLVDTELCLPGRTYKHFSNLEFLVVANAAAFFWSLCFFFGGLLCLGKVKLGRDVSSGVHSAFESRRALENASRYGLPRIAFYGDLVFCFLTFASACAVAGFRSGLTDLDAGYCAGVGKGWCDRMTTSSVFAFMAAVCFAPSVSLNAANKEGPW